MKTMHFSLQTPHKALRLRKPDTATTTQIACPGNSFNGSEGRLGTGMNEVRTGWHEPTGWNGASVDGSSYVDDEGRLIVGTDDCVSHPDQFPGLYQHYREVWNSFFCVFPPQGGMDLRALNVFAVPPMGSTGDMRSLSEFDVLDWLQTSEDQKVPAGTPLYGPLVEELHKFWSYPTIVGIQWSEGWTMMRGNAVSFYRGHNAKKILGAAVNSYFRNPIELEEPWCWKPERLEK